MYVWLVETHKDDELDDFDIDMIAKIDVFDSHDTASWFIAYELSKLPKEMGVLVFSHNLNQGSYTEHTDNPIYKFSKAYINQKEQEFHQYKLEGEFPRLWWEEHEIYHTTWWKTTRVKVKTGDDI